MIRRCDLVPQYEGMKKGIDVAISRVLLSGVYILGNEVAAFEREFASYIGSAYAIGVANGTDGLSLALKALGVKSGDEVITTPFTAIPTVSAIINAGATPVFADVHSDTYLIDLDKVREAISSRTRAVVIVHLFGNVVNVPLLRSIIGDDIKIVEDACQAHGSQLQGKKAGAMGDAGVFSFYPTKNLGGYGDGGIVVTNSAEIDGLLKRLRMYGMVDKDHTVEIGANSRLDELQAAILRVKLPYLDEMNKKRNEIAQRYYDNLRKDLLIPQFINDGIFSNYHVYVSRFRGDRKAFVEYMDKHDIQTNIYYPLSLHLQEAFKYLGYTKGDFPVAEKLCGEVVALPMYPELDVSIHDHIIETINGYRN